MDNVQVRLALVLTEKIRELEWSDIETVRWYVAQVKALCSKPSLIRWGSQ